MSDGQYLVSLNKQFKKNGIINVGNYKGNVR